jgi:hypothetical protein
MGICFDLAESSLCLHAQFICDPFLPVYIYI